jgi:carbamoyl-phosphate synthase large subunit
LIERFVAEAGFRGPVDIDLFEVDGRYYISEVNPRFGGGYPHAHACGCDFTKLIVNNLNGIANERRIGDYEEGVCMMKYSDMAILRESELVKS